jgi:hypothetical protein
MNKIIGRYTATEATKANRWSYLMTGDRNKHTFPDEVPGSRQEMI